MFSVDLRSVPVLLAICCALLIPLVMWVGAKELVLLPGGIIAMAGVAVFVFAALPRWQRRVRLGGVATAVLCGIVASLLAVQASSKASDSAFWAAEIEAVTKLREAVNGGTYWSLNASDFDQHAPRLLPKYAPLVSKALAAAQTDGTRLNIEIAKDACFDLVAMETSVHARTEIERSGYRRPESGPWLDAGLAKVLHDAKGKLPHSDIISDCGKLFGIVI